MVTQSKKTRAAQARPSSPSQGETAPATSAADSVSPDVPGRPVAGAPNTESIELLAESTPAEGGTILPSQPSSNAGSAEPVSAGDPSATDDKAAHGWTEPAAGEDKPAAGEDSQGKDGQGEYGGWDDEVVTVAEYTITVPVTELLAKADVEAEERYLVLGNIKVHGRLREPGEIIDLTPTLAASIVAAENAVAVPEELELDEGMRLTANEVAVMVGIIAGMAEDD